MPTQRKSKLAIGSHVLFRIADVVNIRPMEFFQSADPDLIVEGKITDFSDSGTSKEKYAILSVEGLAELLVVPKSKLRKI